MNEQSDVLTSSTCLQQQHPLFLTIPWISYLSLTLAIPVLIVYMVHIQHYFTHVPIWFLKLQIKKGFGFCRFSRSISVWLKISPFIGAFTNYFKSTNATLKILTKYWHPKEILISFQGLKSSILVFTVIRR